MSVRRHLRVIGSRRIYQHFLPLTGDVFNSCEFILSDPADAEQLFCGEPRENSLSIVINPFEYSLQSVQLMTGEVWLWFLSRVAEPEPEVFVPQGRLGQQAREILKSRKHFVRAIEMKDNWKIVVSDPASRDYCEAHGVTTMLSPPPVGVNVRPVSAGTRQLKADFLVFTDSSDYSRPFRAAMSQLLLSGSAKSETDLKSWLTASHYVVIGESVLPDFPYEVAVGLTLRKTVIAGGLNPLWGLESGIDFLAVSTPEELFHLIEMINRFPQRTHLMARRGMLKSEMFSSDLIYSRLMYKE